MIKCRHCDKPRRKSMMVSTDPSHKYFQICGSCVGQIEYEELQRDLEHRRAEKARDAAITKAVQEEAAEAETPEEVRDAAKEVVSTADLVQRAREELAIRELCRRSLLDFIFRFKPDYKAGWVHRVICKRLEKFLDDVVNRRSPRLALFMPPRHGKSEIVSDKFPSWVLGQYPHMEIMLTSYALSLATDFSRANRDRLFDPAYQEIFPQTRVDPKAQGAELWRTTRRGGFLAAGVGGPITGRGADVFIVDDPVKNYEEAESETVRESVKNWWRSTARPRLSPGGGVLIIMTRWHDDDLSGYLLRAYEEGLREGVPKEELEKFEVVSLPAIADEEEYVDADWNIYDAASVPEKKRVLRVRKPGDPLHPARYSLAYLHQTKRTMGDRMFGALYQQNPVPESGDFFRSEDFRYYVHPPHLGIRPVYFAFDLALSQKHSGDFTVGFAAMLNELGEVTILDMLRGRWRVAEITDRMVDVIERYKFNAAKLGVEQGTMWLAIKEELERKLRERNLSVTIDATLKPMTDKRIRARPLQAWMQAGKLKFPAGQPWMDQVRSELLRFDAGVHDDCVDALAWLVRMLEHEAIPDIDTVRRAKDGFYMSKKQMLADYEALQQGGASSTKRFMAG
jgi:predicted phage terminase large subunit-like protein